MEIESRKELERAISLYTSAMCSGKPVASGRYLTKILDRFFPSPESERLKDLKNLRVWIATHEHILFTGSPAICARLYVPSDKLHVLESLVAAAILAEESATT
jgi:hypothetical protein